MNKEEILDFMKVSLKHIENFHKQREEFMNYIGILQGRQAKKEAQPFTYTK